MVAIHEFLIHAECPLVCHKQWDYYTVTLQTEEEVDVHWLESVMDSVRGIRATQEQIAICVRQQLDESIFLEVVGRHSQNSKTKVVG
jgi:hypothetical protein